MSLQLLNLSELHNRRTDVFQTLGGQVRRSDVLDIRRQVDARVLLSVAVGSCNNVSQTII